MALGFIVKTPGTLYCITRIVKPLEFLLTWGILKLRKQQQPPAKENIMYKSLIFIAVFFILFYGLCAMQAREAVKAITINHHQSISDALKASGVE
jgi:hypothetical protein